MLQERLSVEKSKLAAQKKEIVEGLPHLYEKKFYRWARAFYESTNKMNLLCAANQIGKSSVQIRKCIDWATNTKKWPLLWRDKEDRPVEPRIFIYCYPSYEVATIEFEKKWIPEFMPRNAYRTHPVYGWSAEYDKKTIKAIHFNSGVSVFFKAYTQDPKNLQTSTCHAVFTDEELPEELFSELSARLYASKGYFHMVFTATLNQEMWFRAIEGTGKEEMFPDAFKLQVSMRDCLLFEDGTPGQFSEADIKHNEAMCKSDAERKRRIDGRFISDSGRKFHAFDPTRHYKPRVPIPPDWQRFAAVDLGSGGGVNHPAAIIFLAVRPDMLEGYVYKAWRGDYDETTDGDVFNKFLALREPGEILTKKVYDWQAKDFGMIATRAGDPFDKAEKSHELGESILNTLFQNDMIFLFDDDDEIRKLGVELMLLMKNTPKTKAKDDLCDALRYCLVGVPWDFSHIRAIKEDGSSAKEPFDPVLDEIRRRRGELPDERDEGWGEIGDEIDFWNTCYGS